MNKKLINNRRILSMLSVMIMIGTMRPYSVKAEPAYAGGNIKSYNDIKDISNSDSSITYQELKLNNNIVSMTEKKTLHVSFRLPKGIKVDDIKWTYGGKALYEWKKSLESDSDDSSFITVDDIKVTGDEIEANIIFDLPYGTDNLAEGRFQNPIYKSLIGTFNLAAEVNGEVIAQASVKLLPYDSFCSYDDLKTKIDEITKQAAGENNRYIKTTSIGKSAQGRDIYFTILAKDEESVKKYENIINPAMMDNPEKLQQDIITGVVDDYKVPVFINNIHPNESPGVSAIVNFFNTIALDKQINYDTKLDNGDLRKVNLDIDDVLDNIFFLMIYTDNPDGLANMTRANDDYFDLNRDNSYQTQPESRSVTEQIAKWSPISFLDLHGFDSNFLIEPCTPPHNPNVEYDLLIDNMLKQANVMGNAGITNTKYDDYYIPYEEHQKSLENPDYISKGTDSHWDDASPAYTAAFAMNHGSMGHTIEVPEMNEESTRALVYSIAAAADFVSSRKEELFLNQLKIYQRGVNNIDDYAVDKYLVNAKNEQIGRPRQDNENFFPEYYVLPVDKDMQKNPLEVYKMIEYFLRNKIKVECLKSDITVGDTTYKKGSFIIDMHQAKHGIVNLVLYDGIDASDFDSLSGEMVQNFPDLRGFNCYKVRKSESFKGFTDQIQSVSIPITEVPKDCDYIIIKNTNNDAIKAVNKLLSEDKKVTMMTQGGSEYEAGDFVVLSEDLIPLSSEYFLDLRALHDKKPSGKELKNSKVTALGETAYVLKKLGFKVTEEQSEGDILINTFDSEDFINAGKPYIAFGNMGMLNIKDLIPGFRYEGPEWERYEGVFLTDVMQDNAVTAPYDKEEYFYTITGSYITSVPKNSQLLITMSNKDDFFKAGWWPVHDAAKGKIMAFKYKENNRNLTVFANDLINDYHTQNQFRLLANSIFDAQIN